MWAVYGTGWRDWCHDLFFFLMGGTGTLLVWGGANATDGWAGFCDS